MENTIDDIISACFYYSQMPQTAKRGLKIFLLLALVVAGWVVAFRYHVDLVVVDLVIKVSQTDPDRVYSDLAGSGRFFYGPIAVVLYQPFKWLSSYRALEVAWLTIQSVWFVVFWVALHRLFPTILRSSQPLWLWLVVFFFSINPLHNNFQSGNIQTMLCGALLAAELLSRHPSRWAQLASGVLVMGSAAIKVFPAFMVLYYLMVKPKWVRWGLVAGVGICLALPFLVFGFSGGKFLFEGFWRNLFTYQRDNSLVKISDILCLPSLLARVMTGVGVPAQAQKAISAGVNAAVALAFFALVWVRRQDIRRDSLVATQMLSLGLAVMALINPATRVHYFVFFVPAFCCVLCADRRLTENLVIIFATVALTVQGVVGRHLNNQLEQASIPTIGLIILVAILFKRLSTRVSLEACRQST